MNTLRRLWQKWQFMLTGRFLCDTCKLDYDAACRHAERPNAKTCPDYQKRG